MECHGPVNGVVGYGFLVNPDTAGLKERKCTKRRGSCSAPLQAMMVINEARTSSAPTATATARRPLARESILSSPQLMLGSCLAHNSNSIGSASSHVLGCVIRKNNGWGSVPLCLNFVC